MDGGAAEYRQGLAAVGRTVFQAAENTNSLMSNYDPLTPLTPSAVGRTVFQAAENTNSLMSNYDPLTPSSAPFSIRTSIDFK
jgi:hypothetical protein